MGFFKKIKDKIFSLDIEDDKNNNKTTTKKDLENKEREKESKIKEKLYKADKKKRNKETKIDKYVAGLGKTNTSFSQSIKSLQSRHNKLNEDFFEELEEILIMSDISINLVLDIIDAIKQEVKMENVVNTELISEIIGDKMFAIYTHSSLVDTELKLNNNGLNIALVVGVNGAGKTTSIAKIANKYKLEGKKILIAAGDTFRAGAVEQLGVWANKIGVDIVKPEKEGADPASVVFKALAKAKEESYDLLIIDTAGRLQNKVNLMNELSKINKIIQREVPDAPHESLLVLDATTGQNGVLQAKEFKSVTHLTGIILTKMDGTSKGGIVLTIKEQLDLVVKMVGLGEKLDDLQEFDLEIFIYGMMKGLME